MSFKYRFILSFVLLEMIFIVLIVAVNFVAINDSSKKLIGQNIKSNMDFLDELVKIPISIYDLATLDDIVFKTSSQENIDSIVVTDSLNRILSQSFNFKYKTLDEVLALKKNENFVFKEGSYEFRTTKILEDNLLLGYIYVIFDTSENSKFINKSLRNSAFIILIEILISTLLSYIIGSKLTKMLTRLSLTAKEIGEYKYPEVPYQNKKGEIGILAKSMAQMLVDLKYRRDKLKALAQQLSLQKDELLEANKSKDDFLANMSHELKTPLNSINVISSVMMKNKNQALNEEQVKNLTIINKCGNDLLFLINDVLDISKLEAGEVSLNLRTIILKDLMTEIKDMFEPQALQKGLNFDFAIDEKLYKIYSDDHRIKQIVKNLLSNALKFVKKGSIQLIVKDFEDDFVILVIDDGIGIDKNKLEHVFDRFKQADESTTRKYGGTGLGLAICKELANLLDGDISVESKLDKGTSFKVRLPKNLEKVDFDDEVKYVFTKYKTQLQKYEQKQNIVQEKKNVLLLNNDPVSFMSLAIQLKEYTNLEQVSNLLDLLKSLKVKKYEKVIIDISKIEIEEISKVIKTLNINFIIVYDKEESLDENIKNKAFKLIKKPINTNALMETIKE